ncbi:hypothetical protein PFTANZ_01813 [Plasmodium falciparum Tanzania (2000708)]|uniref:Cilia- and flagella-associated protein 91 n=1 Tax=Plasmodium falciparum Tanzania (2000708) TaxID=1036725 RepID=A0A024WA86_PLAFA|nr:hypothetical protein PFTANZ_01813 [Plasmodium falciparum Tanzania (2000708)]
MSSQHRYEKTNAYRENDENIIHNENRKNINRRNDKNYYGRNEKSGEKLKNQKKKSTYDSKTKTKISDENEYTEREEQTIVLNKENKLIDEKVKIKTLKMENKLEEDGNDNNIDNMNDNNIDNMNDNNIDNMNDNYIDNMNDNYMDNMNDNYMDNMNDQEEKNRKEIKEIANLCLEQNLSVNSENILIVRKLKEKRKLEERINKNENIKNLQEKRRILEEIEYHEWADREKRIKELQEKKMNLLKKVLVHRDKKKANKIFYEVEKIVQNRDKKKDEIRENFEKEKAKDMRILFLETGNNLKTIYNEKQDLINQMNNYTSNFYLQLEREGVVPNKINENIINKIDNNLNDLKKLNEIKSTLDETSYHNNIRYTFKGEKSEERLKYENKKNKKIIDTFYRYLNKEEKKYSSDKYSTIDNRKVQKKKKTQSMKTIYPNIMIKNKEQDSFEKNVLYLQNILRGKAIKILMNDGKNSYSDLIEELKAYEKIDEYSAQEKEFFEKENFEEMKIDSYIENVQGKYISELLDNLSKELEKYEEERKIAVLVKYAERERRLKECKEKGKRQAEFLLREKEDYLFNEIMGLNNKTVDSYLEDILTKTINDVSKEEALIKTKMKAEQLNDIYNSLDNKNDENNKLIIKDLVGNFIIPYVDKKRGAEFQEMDQKKNNCASSFATQNVFSKINQAF